MDRKLEKKNWTIKKVVYYTGGAIFVLFVLYIFVFSDSSSRLNVDSERITISTVKFGPFNENTPITGTVQPIETYYLDVTEGGRVMEKFVQEGAYLEEGDPIIRLDNAQLRLSIIYNEANVFQQINNLRSTRLSFEQNKLSLKKQLLDLKFEVAEEHRNFNTDKNLFDKNLISANQFASSKDRYHLAIQKFELTEESYKQDSIFRSIQIGQLEKSVGTLEENLNATKQQLDNLTVKAPITGQLTSLKAEIGESIASGQNLGQIDNIDSFKVRAQVDEHYIARVNPGQTGTFTFAGKEFSLIIKTVFPEVRNGRFEVDMHFVDEVPAGIRRGQTVHIKLSLSELRDALMVDRGGFYQTTGGQWIFVLDESGEFATRRKISLGQQNTQYYEVLSGLKEGEKVITSTYDNFGDNEKLILK
ncbi:MAG: efflux RND transporter periplasmic adaptor subunit [Melioribacteraceae bacterium]|nr:efflux RND transporter periplasmic adaptor subunit [Melioribacteraceae bacterium]MCF8356219.1 efflux RND transporter periplasmic adaptor subunit [Melioribacteraceae bacterium]MCF8395626.1 efflux RND transporter periplasmic adaptor subunit [Melioribacteraceae bacterium]MCF8420633.1 efflux RND transporter periplasmic adaptor subunit [Melioribacteraceae bacterium]